MSTLIDVAITGVQQVLLHPLRNLVTVFGVTAVLVPYITAIGISLGIQQDAEISIDEGADLYVSGHQFGQSSPVPWDASAKIAEIEGVVTVTPRISGPLMIGKNRIPAVVVGLSAERMPPQVECVEGRLFHEAAAEIVVGSRLARQLGLRPGDRVPPFYRGSRGDRVCQVVGVFRCGVTVWETNLLFTSLPMAAEIFDRPGMATEFLVTCRPGYADSVRERIVRTIRFSLDDGRPPISALVTARKDLRAQIPAGLSHREGIFNLLFLVAFVVGILVVLVTSGFGLQERQREVAILKATGWMTDQLLLRSSTESFLLSLSSASLALICSFIWLRWCNGFWIAGVFLYGVGSDLETPVPYRLTPWPIALAYLLSFVVIMSGTSFSTWRAAIAAPCLVMRK